MSKVTFRYKCTELHYVGIPEVIYTGDTVKFIVDIESYKSSDNYKLVYRFINAEGREFEIESTPINANGHLIEIPAAITETLEGEFIYQAAVVGNSIRVIFDTGRIKTVPGLEGTGFIDTRTHAEKTLEVIEAALEGKLTKDVAEYAINGRSIKRYSIESLIMLRDKYRREVNAEKRASKFGRGLQPNKIRVRF